MVARQTAHTEAYADLLFRNRLDAWRADRFQRSTRPNTHPT